MRCALPDQKRRWIKTGLACVGFFGLFAFGLLTFTPSAFAVATDPIVAAEQAAGAAEGSCTAGGPAPVPCPPRGIKESLRTVGEKIVSPSFRIALIQALLNLSQFVLNRLAFEAAVAISSGGSGESSLFYSQTPAEAFGQLGLEVAGEAVGTISELSSTKLGIQFNLCEPTSPVLQLALAVGIKQKYQPEAPKCDFMEVLSNWESFGANIYQTYVDPEGRQQAILSAFASALRPGQNELTAALRINIAIDQKVHEQKLLQFLQQNEREYKSITDFITGNVKTPSETLQADFEAKLREVNGEESRIRVGELANAGELIGGLALSTASTFTNVLLSQLLNRIYTGLFETETTNPFDVEAVAGGDKEAAQERFASIITTNPIATTEYDALSEFVVCTAEGTINRGLNNCVMDVNFLAAVNRGTAGVPLTVQEAIDEGLLNGDWPLIPPTNKAANQDPFCYTYGYCYGNLVKLRKARVIPIGWELAAQRNSESSPATLQEVIDGFNDCTDDGTIGPANASDSGSKWCHLIDPNWVLKYPKTECRAIGNGEIRISTLSTGRNSTCVDAPSCIGEDNDGDCVDGYGYCVQEKNVWRFRGDECPQQYATCLSFTNTQTQEDGDFLVNTVDYGVCNQDNAGCRWYRTQKYFDDAGTSDLDDDSFEWLASGDDYVLAERDDDWNYSESGASVLRQTYGYASDSGETYTYDQYAYEDRLYLTNNATACSQEDVGCSQLYAFDEDLYLNSIINPSFENDEDDNSLPDGWTPTSSSGYAVSTAESQFGSSSVLFPSGTYLYQDVAASANNFYTVSSYFEAQSSGDEGIALIMFLDEDGNRIDASGTSSAGDCEWLSGLNWYEMSGEPSTDDFDRFDCLVTAPDGTVQIRVTVGNSASSSGSMYVDAIQLELGEDVHDFTEGYSATPTASYYQIAPSYLGCSGNETDSEACDDYAQVCDAQEVGCSLYTPEDGDPSVPAIISELDQCPSECVGYTTYKQEATPYDSEEFPLYFIADSASACSQQYVGCDAYTNLGTLEAGGEDVEYYTSLRFCLSTNIADRSSADTTPATYFTWEGSDREGYQLQTWYLLESNYAGSTDTFDESGFEETDPGLAPCTHIRMDSENEVACRDTNSAMQSDVWSNEECDEHDDIFENPDCREFFDTQGNIHYREYSDTISISDACTAYRKDESEETDCEESGGYWTDQGFCRYYVLPEGSNSCPSEQSGCREYTGGAGRNATTILSETFESGTYDAFAIAEINSYPDELSISNESIATEGHSLYVLAPSSGMAGIETVQIHLGPDTTDSYDADDSTTCTGTVTQEGCEVAHDIDGDGSDDETCTVKDGQESCGTLTDVLVAGKTFVLQFWAKGSGDLFVTFEEEGGDGVVRDFVDPDATINTSSDLTPVTLDGSWALYSLGPLDTSSFEAFDENTVVRFATDAGKEFYLDNITLKQVEENITRIKDSWVVPSTCDQTPDGVDSPQYYLGCEAYSDQDGDDVDVYQFSDLCSEDVVGCQGFYTTANSESPYTQTYNARCAYSTDDDFSDVETVSTSITCEVDNVEYCTISAGQGYCTFDADQGFAGTLPYEAVDTSTYFGIVFGPETVVVPGDTPVYIVVNEDAQCTSSAMGCAELGNPSYTQDQSEVEGFDAVYYLNLPEEYGSILCEDEALFCEEWESTQDGNFYFKDPLDKTCEYKTSVTLENVSYAGWFRSGTSEPCYWEDKDGDGSYSKSAGDEAYLIAGESFGVWRNGDEDDGDDDAWDYYNGWIAACENTYDLCTEFIDVVDTGGGFNENGQSYYFTNDELLSEETLTDSQRCNGQVSQRFGCALFNNTTISELTYNASASYALSTHADVFYGEEKNSLVDPVSCTTPGGGEFTISDNGASAQVNLCARRCAYTVSSGDAITTTGFNQGETDTLYYGASCFEDADCRVETTDLSDEVEGTCTDVDDDYALQDDTNEVLKVNRDRTCAAWVAGSGAQVSWNTQTNTYDYVYDSIEYCVEGTVEGQKALCTGVNDREPTVLSTYAYSSRDVSWNGYEYSGMSIPDQLPVELYDQFNIAAQSVCVDTNGDSLSTATYVENGDPDLPRACGSYADCPLATGLPCDSDSDCGSASGVCDTDNGYCYYACANSNETDYRLVYNAGPCDSTENGSGNGGSCTVGHCSDSGNACAQDGDCDSGESCVVGYLQATGSEDCVNEDCACNPDVNADDGTNADCTGSTSASGVSTPVCDPVQFVCVDELTTDEENRDPCVEDSPTRTCVPIASSSVGSCFNNRCLADIRDVNGDGSADRLESDDAREQSCRAYPEIDSPFPTDVVSSWIQYSDVDTTDADGDGDNDEIGPEGESPGSIQTDFPTDPTSQAALPYSYVNGFQDSNVCALDENGDPVDCICSYNKADYGDGTAYRYFDQETGIDEVPQGICSGGPVSGIPCQDDDDCTVEEQSGSCSYVTRVDSIYGWHGYCIEKDTSIQTLGSSDDEDQACLTWLPVDQLTGATDLYAKYTSAGYSPQNTYYCAEVEVGYTVGTSNIACAETQDNLCNDADWAVFRNESDNSAGGQDDCVAGIWCPDGYFAVMTGCGKLDEENECTSSGDTDCPYFCVPKLSYKTADDDQGNSGDYCLTPDAALDIDVDTPPHLESTKAEVEDGTNNGAYYVNVSSVGDHWAGSQAPNIRVYVLPPTDFANAREYYNDCEVRGVVESIGEFTYSEYTADGGGVDTSSVNNLITEYEGSKGFRNLIMDIVPEAVCTTTVQVSSKSLEEEDTLPFETYNAAWTNRLWENTDTNKNTYSLSSDDEDHLGYAFGTLQSPYGKATDYLTLELETDPEPHALSMCRDGSTNALTLPTVDLDCDSSDLQKPDSDGEDARAYMDLSLSATDDGLDSNYCYYSDCSCPGGDSAGTRQELCEWDPDLGAPISCTDRTCEEDSSVSCESDEDCEDAGLSGACGAGVCAGGPYDGATCDEDNECETENYCAYGSPEESGVCKGGSVALYSFSDGEASDAIDLLSQIFGRMYAIVNFNDDGYEGISSSGFIPDDESDFTSREPLGSFADPYDFETENFETEYADWIWNTRATGQDDPTDHVPVVVSIGECEGSQCYEGVEGKFSVNGTDSQDIEGEGTIRVTVDFYAHADSNQMPIRRIIVDWGDDFASITPSGNPWPSGSYSGSVASDNFYKNHRGLDPGDNLEVCSSDADEFGETSEACSSSYISFTHDYTCNAGRLEQLEGRECQFDSETGRLLNSPCLSGESCVFQPRVHVIDNWGWCTGFCNAGADETDACFTGVLEDGSEQDECNISDCPSENNPDSQCEDADGGTVNPWINYDGVISIVEK